MRLVSILNELNEIAERTSVPKQLIYESYLVALEEETQTMPYDFSIQNSEILSLLNNRYIGKEKTRGVK